MHRALQLLVLVHFLLIPGHGRTNQALATDASSINQDMAPSLFPPANSENETEWWDGKDSANAKLMVHEIKRAPLEQGSQKGPALVVVGLEASGFSKNKQYELWTDRIGGRNKIAKLAVNADGDLAAANPDGSLGPSLSKFNFALGGFAKGEVINYALISVDHTYKAFARFTPFPLEVRQGKCRLWLEVLNSDNDVFVARGEGFKPGEAVRWISRSDGEVIEKTEVASAEGFLDVDILAVATKAHQRRAILKVSAKSCSLSLDYEWGRP